LTAESLQWWRWDNGLWQTVPDLSCGNRKSTVANSRQLAQTGLPRVQTSTGQRSFAYSGPAVWSGTVCHQPCAKTCHWLHLRQKWKRIFSGVHNDSPRPPGAVAAFSRFRRRDIHVSDFTYLLTYRVNSTSHHVPVTLQLSLVLTVLPTEGWLGWVDLGGWLHTARRRLSIPVQRSSKPSWYHWII